MFDENEHIHPQNNDEGPRHIHRGIKRSEPDEVEVDSADFSRSEERRVGKECLRLCRSRWSPYH